MKEANKPWHILGGGEVLAAENQQLKQLIGELTIANNAFKKILEGEKRR